MEVICIEDEAFYTLIEQVVKRLEKQHEVTPDRWIEHAEAMRLLGIKSKSTLQKLRDEGKIRFSQPQKRIILYDRTSIDSYLQKHARNPF